MVSSKLAERFDLLDYAYAHRGLWAPDEAPENSIEAYKAAADAGLGLELDVRPSADGIAMCFHDPTLERMTDTKGRFENRTSADLETCRLVNGTKIPTFDELLSFWPQRLPMLIEMKIDGKTDAKQFSSIIAAKVAKFAGKAAIISFSEDAVSAVPDSIMRGQLIYPTSKVGTDNFKRVKQRGLSTQVDFFAVNIADADRLSETNVPAVCWTVRTADERERAQRLGFAEIFEHLPIPLAAP